MANAEHLRILKKQGVDAWNAWRRTTNVRSNLSRGNFRFANLHSADLSRADLSNANLAGANLSKASLVRANLIGADLGRTDLSGADLSGANLAVAFLGHDINLIGTDLSGARLSGTIFSGADLSHCKNLESIHHMGPSTIDIRSLQRSGPLPLSFLRGVGLPEKLIDYLPSLLGEATYYSCFISYSTKDDDFVHSLYADLQDKGVRCWFAPHDLSIGAKILDTIDEAIRLRDKVLLVLSEAAIASDWVEDEVTKAFAEERQRGGVVLFPVRLDDAVFATKEAWALKLRDNRNIGDFREWKNCDAYLRTLERLLRDLRVETETT